MKVTLLNYTQNALDLMIFTKHTRLNLNPSAMRAIKDLSTEEKLKEIEYISNTIPSSWEFVDYTFLVEGVSRAYTHQQVRTRAASYAQQSMRVNGMAEFAYIYTEKNKEDPRACAVIYNAISDIKRAYSQLIELGQGSENSRGILPTNISTNIVCKFNLRTFADLAKSRTGGRTQEEYQQVINAMVNEVLKVHQWAEKFIFTKERDYFDEIEQFAEKEPGSDLIKKGELLKIVDKMRKE